VSDGKTDRKYGRDERINKSRGKERKEGKEEERRGRRQNNRPDIKYTKKLKKHAENDQFQFSVTLTQIYHA
jgi:hypothetical protein